MLELRSYIFKAFKKEIFNLLQNIREKNKHLGVFCFVVKSLTELNFDGPLRS